MTTQNSGTSQNNSEELELSQNNSKELELSYILPEGSKPTDQQRYLDTLMFPLGINNSIYNRLTGAATAKNCTIWIRSTNPGVIEGFSEGKNVTGKTLHTKGKSSEYPPCIGNLAFLSSLSKSAVKTSVAERTDAFWDGLITEQDTLLEVVLQAIEKATSASKYHPDQFFIPKIISAKMAKALFRIPENSDPKWIHMEISQSYYSRVSYEGRQEPQWFDKYNQQLTLGPTRGLSSDTPINMLWVRYNNLKDINAHFREEFQGLKPGSKKADANWTFQGCLVPHAEAKDEAYYRLYCDPASLPRPTVDKRAAVQKWTNYWKKRGEGVPDDNEYNRFMPKMAKGQSSVVEEAHRSYRGFSVLGQLRIDPSAQDKNLEDMLTYYEIVADYDVFCIAPHLSVVQDVLLKQQLRAGEPQDKVIAEAHSLFPTFSTQEGLISDFERTVRTSINASLVAKGNDWTRELIDTSTAFVLHGCEVNNYFYTEASGDLIMINPGYTANENKYPRFRSSSRSFLGLLRSRSYNEPEVSRQAFAVPDKDKHTAPPTFIYPKHNVKESHIMDEYLPQVNFAWGWRAVSDEGLRAAINPEPTLLPGVKKDPAAELSEKLVSGVFLGLARKNKLPETIKTSADVQSYKAQAARLWYYAGYYWTLYGSLGHACKELCSHTTDTSIQDRYINKLAEARKTIRLALQQLSSEIDELRKKVHFYEIPDLSRKIEMTFDQNTLLKTKVLMPAINDLTKFATERMQTPYSVSSNTALEDYIRQLEKGKTSVSALWLKIFRQPLDMDWMKDEQKKLTEILERHITTLKKDMAWEKFIKVPKPPFFSESGSERHSEVIADSLCQMIIEAWQKTANDEAERSTEQIAFQGETDSKEAHPIQEEINYTKFKLFRRHIEKIYRIITIYNLQLQVYSKYEVGDKNLPSLKVDRAQSAAANRLPSSAEEGQRTEVEKIATGRLRPASAPTTR